MGGGAIMSVTPDSIEDFFFNPTSIFLRGGGVHREVWRTEEIKMGGGGGIPVRGGKQIFIFEGIGVNC